MNLEPITIAYNIICGMRKMDMAILGFEMILNMQLSSVAFFAEALRLVITNTKKVIP